MTDNQTGYRAPVQRLEALLRELLQLDLADLDFGIYRLLNARRTEIEAFLSEELPRHVDDSFAGMSEAQRQAAEHAAGALAEQIRSEIDPEAVLPSGEIAPEFADQSAAAMRRLLDEYREARHRLAETAATDEQKAEVFNHLHAFLSRYFDSGDFMPHRRYGRHETYAVPYNGEETLFHWVNREQHYVKTGEQFRDYAFRLPTTDARVRFTLTAATTARENTKGDVRYFFPLVEQVTWDTEQCLLLIPFEYRLPTEGEAAGQTAAKLQETLLGGAVNGIVESVPDAAVRATLLSPDPNRQNSDDSLLLRRLRHFTRRNTTDYFIHRDLGGFLHGELDFYVKDQVVHLADLDGDLGPRQRMLRVVRELAEVVIGFLAELEDAQRRLFEKRKFVLRTDYLVTMRCVPRGLWPTIAASEVQRHAWKELFAIESEEIGTDEAAFTAFFESHPTLVVDTHHFDAAFRDDLLASFDDLDDITDGLLVHGENYQALRLLAPTLAGGVKCIYIDPPYNTGNDGFIYKDRYRHASWLAMMAERVALLRSTLQPQGLLMVSCNDIEVAELRFLLDQMLSVENLAATFIWNNDGNIDNQSKLKGNHEYIHTYAGDIDSFPRPPVIDPNIEESSKLYRDEIENSITKNGPANPPSVVTLPPGFPATFESGTVDARPDAFPKIPEAILVSGYALTDARDIESGWSSRNLLRLFIDNGFQPIKDSQGLETRFALTPSGAIYGYKKRSESQGHVLTVIRNVGTTKQNSQMLARWGLKFDWPKPLLLIRYLCQIASVSKGDVVLDCFAGSGTTGHAVIELGRLQGNLSRFVLIDFGQSFDETLVPRIQKATYATYWNNGKPTFRNEPALVEASPRIVKVVRIEGYEDSLASVEPAGRGLLDGVSEAASRSPALLRVELLEEPFDYEVEVLTDAGSEKRTVDLVETFNLAYGVHVNQVKVWTNDADGGRRYRAIMGRRDGKRMLILWRDMTGLDPRTEREFLEERIPPDSFDEALINGDAAVPAGAGRPAVRSLDPIFKRLIEDEDR